MKILSENGKSLCGSGAKLAAYMNAQQMLSTKSDNVGNVMHIIIFSMCTELYNKLEKLQASFDCIKPGSTQIYS